jgi:hypothetical protein
VKKIKSSAKNKTSYLDYIKLRIEGFRTGKILRFPIERIKVNVEMWEHFCPQEGYEMYIGKDEPCNWCGEYENDQAE